MGVPMPGKPTANLGSGVLPAVLMVVMLMVPAAALAQVQVPVSWDRNRDAMTAGYRVYVGSAPGTTQSTIDTGQATSTLLALHPGATYFMRVRAYTADGTLGPASSESIIDLAATPAEPRDMAALTHGSTAVLSWSSPLGGGAPLGYLVSVGTAPGAANLLNDYPVGNVLALTGSVPPGVYYARVRARNYVGTGPPSSDARFDVRNASAPFRPVNLSLEWAGTTARLSWSRPTDAWGTEMPQYYVVEAGTAPGLANLGRFSAGNTTSYQVDVPPGTYYVRIRGVGTGGMSEPSNEIVVSGRGVPGTARQLSATVSGGVIHLSWAAPLDDAAGVAGYIIEAGSAPGASNLASVVVAAGVRQFSAAAPPGVYYVRVRAANARGVGAPSNEVVVTP